MPGPASPGQPSPSEEPVALPSTSLPSQLAASIARYVELAEAVLPPGWERSLRSRHHPVAKRVHALKGLLAATLCLRLPEEAQLLPMLAEAVLDSSGLADRDALAFSATTPEQFLDALVKMHVAGWHRQHGHGVRGIERKDGPDLRVNVPGQEREMLVACRRVKTISPDSVEKELAELNQRFRDRKSNDVTVGVLHLSLPLQRAVDADAVPPFVHFARSRARDRFVKGKLSHTDCVVFSWDDYVYSQDPALPKATATLRRRTRSFLPPGPIDDALRPYAGHRVDIAAVGPLD